MANVITTCRIVLSLALIGCPVFSRMFYWLYITAGITDAIDGSVARLMNQETEFGSKLDTAADFLFTAVVLVKVLKKVYVPRWLIIWCICIAIIKAVNVISGIVVSGHFVAEHTLANKVCGVLLFAIPLCIRLFPHKPVDLLTVLTCIMATIAAIQEGYKIRNIYDCNTRKTF